MFLHHNWKGPSQVSNMRIIGLFTLKQQQKLFQQATGLIIHNYKWDTCFSNNSSYVEKKNLN